VFPYACLNSASAIYKKCPPAYTDFADEMTCGKNSLDVDFREFTRLQADEGISAQDALAVMHLVEAPEPGPVVYRRLVRRWESEGIVTIGQLMVNYMKQDCIPMAKAIKQLMAIYHKVGIQFLKNHVSLPSCSLPAAYKISRDAGDPVHLLGVSPFWLKELTENLVGG